MSLFPVVLSLIASFFSSNGMLGAPAETYMRGFNFWFILTGTVVGIPASAYYFMPVFYDLQITSVYEYLERRFDRKTRVCGSLLSIATIIIHSSFVTYGPALALSQVTGLSLWGSIFTTVIVATIYTSLGGIKAVLWTDAMQFIVFMVALVTAIVKGIIDVGGFSYIIKKGYEGSRLQPLSFSFDPTFYFTFWSCFINGALKWINVYGINQMQIQRYLCCPTKAAARKSLWLNYPGIVIVVTIYCFLGLVLYANYWSCDPLSSSQIYQADQIFPLFVMHVMKSLPGMPGLFVAGVYSASLSTTSSQLNSLAAITLEDYIRPWYKKPLSDAKATKISKYVALIYGGVTLLMVAAVSNLGSILQSSSYLVGGSQGTNLGLFTLGLLIPWSNANGSIIGMVFGLGLGWWVSLGNRINKPSVPKLPISTIGCNSTLGDWVPFYEPPGSDDVLPIYRINFLLVMPLAWLVTTSVGCVASYLLGGNKDHTDPKLYTSFTRYFLKKFRMRQIKLKHKKATGVSNESMRTQPPPYDDCVELPMLNKNKPNGTDEA